MSLGKLKGSIYVNGYLSGAAEIISSAITGVMANKLGRRCSIVLSFTVAGVAFVAYYPVSAVGIEWSYVSIIVGKFGASCTFSLVYLITTESFPTVFRGTVFGIANIFARVGGILAPVIGGVAQNSFLYVFGGLSLMSGVGSLFLGETKGKTMADTAKQRAKTLQSESEVEESTQKNNELLT